MPFIIENPLCKNILKKFMDEESSDVIFEVACDDNQKKLGSRKKAKSSPVQFHAHSLILEGGAPMLYELSKSGGEIPINDVKPDIFRHMLHYVYGGKVEEDDLKENAKEIIEASDKYGVVHLKLEAEARYVKSATISVDNVMENLLYADSKNCALLKEAVMDFLVDNGEEVSEKVSFENAPGHLMKDLLTAMSNRDKKKAGAGKSKYHTTRVESLRKQLQKKGLDIDGSREAMIARLIEHGGFDDENLSSDDMHARLRNHDRNAVDESEVESDFEDYVSLSEGDDLIREIVVDGCGVPEINGIFTYAGKFDGAPKYSRIIPFRGREEEFTLFRCMLTDNTRRWFISIVPMTSRPGTTRDRDFYAAIPYNAGPLPPRQNWFCLPNNSDAALPSPEVYPRRTHEEDEE